MVIAAVPSSAELGQLEQIGAGRVLVVAGELDGVTRFSHFAARRHVYGSPAGGIRFATVAGAAHHSFANGDAAAPAAIAALDLAADVTPAEAHRSLAGIIAEFAGVPGKATANSGVLAAAEATAARLSGPVVLALELEGSAGLGHPACNSDYPTNPGCKEASPAPLPSTFPTSFQSPQPPSQPPQQHAPQSPRVLLVTRSLLSGELNTPGLCRSMRQFPGERAAAR